MITEKKRQTDELVDVRTVYAYLLYLHRFSS